MRGVDDAACRVGHVHDREGELAVEVAPPHGFRASAPGRAVVEEERDLVSLDDVAAANWPLVRVVGGLGPVPRAIGVQVGGEGGVLLPVTAVLAASLPVRHRVGGDIGAWRYL